MDRPRYRRILLKLSGEALMGDQNYGIDGEACLHIAQTLQKLKSQGIQVALVIGGGNIFRGMNGHRLGMDRTPADQIGMLATLINGVALKQSLENLGLKTHLFSAVSCPLVAENYNWERAVQLLEAGTLLIFVGGTGHPYFTTDSAAALRALEIKADILLKGTKVNGIYNKDPLKYSDAKKFDQITYDEVLAKRLEVMDGTAIALCATGKLPICVFNMRDPDALSALMAGNRSVGTFVEQGGNR